MKGDYPVECYMQNFSVPFEYPVYFTRGVLTSSNTLLESVIKSRNENCRHRALVYIDDGVVAAMPDVPDKIAAYFGARRQTLELARAPEMVPGGERTKNGWNVVQNIMTLIGNSRLCRHSFVIAIGGGSVLDMVGFAASLVHRGLRTLRLPTTVLAQNDAGVGVKTGMDEHGMKNFVGTFAPPFAVLIDFDFLRTVPAKYWTGGIAEAFKVAIIKDAGFFEFLCLNASRLASRDEEIMTDMVKRCAILHLDHIREGGDPFEFGAAHPLDFGHWAAHKLEILSNYEMGHGQAVAVGIALDSCYAQEKGLLTASELDRILCGLEQTGLPIWSRLLQDSISEGRPEILRGLEDFREHLGGNLSITLPDHIGSRIEVHEMDMDIVMKCVGRLKERTGLGCVKQGLSLG